MDAGLQVGSQQSGAEGQNPLLCPAGHTAGDAAQSTVAFWAASAHCQVVLNFSSTNTPNLKVFFIVMSA